MHQFVIKEIVLLIIYEIFIMDIFLQVLEKLVQMCQKEKKIKLRMTKRWPKVSSTVFNSCIFITS